jgi:SAM-dependent methyltransferase
MKWQKKAKIMKIFSNIPMGGVLYKFLQKKFGRLTSDPLPNIKKQIEIANCLHQYNFPIEGKIFFEVGTGHNVIVPVGFFLSGAKGVITVDLYRRLDYSILKNSLFYLTKNRHLIESLYSNITNFTMLNERLDLLSEYWSTPRQFIKMANIQYLSPADAANTNLSNDSIDYHISANTLEHIPYEVIRNIFIEAKRILKDNGIAIHFIDLSDHFQHQDNSISRINFLRFSDNEWSYIAGNQFAYCNRLRVNDYLNLFNKLRFDIVHVEKIIDENSMNKIQDGFQINEKFNSYNLEDICTTSLKIMFRKKDN